jgi:ribosomal protein S13|tara:strand:+ start:175 stop:498 length:324 start_codon:yes stop_codon:yes gene_type:complete
LEKYATDTVLQNVISKMAKELNEETGFNISVKTLIGIGFAMATLIGMWFTLQADIAEAKELPKPEISKMEFDMKDVNIRQSIKNTERNVEKLEERMIRMEDKIDALK